MARTYAKVQVMIWADDDFRQLSDGAQSLYFRILTSPTLNLAGVADWRPRRLAALTKDMEAPHVEANAAELAEARYIIVDDETEEVLLRTFIKHDGVIKNAKVTAGFAKEYAGTASGTIRGVIIHELERLYQESPEFPGWNVLDSMMGDSEGINPWEIEPFKPTGSGMVPAGKALSHHLSDALSHTPSDTQSDRVCHIQQPATSNQQPTTSNPPESPNGVPRTPKTRTYDPQFEKFWTAFPSDRKGAKKQCADKFAAAVREGVTIEEIITAAERYRDDPNREGTFTVSPHRWLNEERWESGPLPSKAPSHDGPSRSELWINEGTSPADLRAIEGGAW